MGRSDIKPRHDQRAISSDRGSREDNIDFDVKSGRWDSPQRLVAMRNYCCCGGDEDGGGGDVSTNAPTVQVGGDRRTSMQIDTSEVSGTYELGEVPAIVITSDSPESQTTEHIQAQAYSYDEFTAAMDNAVDDLLNKYRQKNNITDDYMREIEKIELDQSPTAKSVRSNTHTVCHQMKQISGILDDICNIPGCNVSYMRATIAYALPIIAQFATWSKNNAVCDTGYRYLREIGIDPDRIMAIPHYNR